MGNCNSTKSHRIEQGGIKVIRNSEIKSNDITKKVETNNKDIDV
jgi:hypothetical protein